MERRIKQLLANVVVVFESKDPNIKKTIKKRRCYENANRVDRVSWMRECGDELLNGRGSDHLLRYIGHGVRWGGGMTEKVSVSTTITVTNGKVQYRHKASKEEIKKALSSFAKEKLLERLKNRDLLKAARDKRFRRAAKRAGKKFKFIGTVIDAPNYEETIRFIPANQN